MVFVIRKKKKKKQLIENSLKLKWRGLPRWSSGSNFRLPRQGTWVRSLVKELRSYMPRGVAKELKNINKFLKKEGSLGGDNFYKTFISNPLSLQLSRGGQVGLKVPSP